MKKLFFSFLFLSGFGMAVNAQNDGVRLGLHGGFPISDASDFSSFNLGVDASYLFFNIKDKVAVGASSGYSTFLGKDDFDSYSFIPVAVSGRTTSGKNIFYTADVGYAIALETDSDGGLYYQAKMGWSKNNLDIFAFYKGIEENEISLSSAGIGVAFKL